MTETKATTIRLSDEGRANAELIVRKGLATDLSGAIHVALGALAYRLVNPTPHQRRAVDAVEREVRRQRRR